MSQSADSVPPQVASNQVAKRRLIIESLFAAGQDSMTAGIVTLVYALALGANTFQIGLISTAGMIGSASQLAAESLLRRLGSRRRVGVAGLVALASARAAIGLLPFASAFIAAKYLSWGLLAGLVLVSGAAQVVDVIRYSWVAGVVPTGERGRFLGQRQLAMQLFASVLAIAAAWIFDWQRGISAARGLFTAQSYFWIAGLICLGSLVTFFTIPEPPLAANGGPRGLGSITAPFRDNHFRPVMVYYFVWVLSTSFAGPFFNLFLIEVLKLPLGVVAIYAFFGKMLSLYAVRLWGRLADRFGSKPVIKLCIIGKTMFPLSWLLLWPFSDGHSVFMLYALTAFVFLFNLFNHGTGLIAINLALRMSPEGKETSYLAAFRTFASWIQAFGPALGGALSTVLQDHGWTLETTLYLLCVISATGRISSTLLLRRVPEPGAARLRHVWRALLRVPGFTPRAGLRQSMRFWGEPISSGFSVVRLRIGRLVAVWRDTWHSETD